MLIFYTILTILIFVTISLRRLKKNICYIVYNVDHKQLLGFNLNESSWIGKPFSMLILNILKKLQRESISKYI